MRDGTWHLPERLRELREANDMTRVDLAKASGVSASTIENIETNRTPRPRADTFLSLARGLGVTADELGASVGSRHTPLCD